MATAAPKPRVARSPEPVRRYMVSLPPATRRRMRLVREAIRAAAPEAVEAFSYRIPLFKLDGKALVWYAAFRHHTSLYPMGGAIRRAHAAALKDYETSKGTVRFPLTRPLPIALVRRLVRARVAEVRGSVKP